jgi:hypothetical protein
MFNLQYHQIASAGVAPVHATIGTSRERFESNSDFATDKVPGEIFKVRRRQKFEVIRQL